MNLIDIVDNMSQEMYERMKTAAETGKWPEGTPVDEATRQSAIQLSMAYQARHLDSKEMMTIGSDGQMIHKTKRELKAEFKQEQDSENSQKQQGDNIARFTDL